MNNTCPDLEPDDVETVVAATREDAVPPVTVAITLYNYSKYIAECLESVSAQTVIDLDLIVVDDCSTDTSLTVVREWFAENEERFRSYKLLRHKRNRGLACARNLGFSRARTKNVFVLDADNLLYPPCVERLLSALENCDASFAYCYLEKFGDLHGLQNTWRWDPRNLHKGNTIDAMVLLRKSTWEKVGGYSKMQIMGWEDFDLWFKIARQKGWGVRVPEILARYRVHGSSMLVQVTNPKIKKLWPYFKSTYPEFFAGERLEKSSRSPNDIHASKRIG